MNRIEKKILKLFIDINTPKEFVETIDKSLMDDYIKGNCITFIENGKIDKNLFQEMTNFKNEWAKDINFNDNDNVIYFDLMRLCLAIIKKYLY